MQEYRLTGVKIAFDCGHGYDKDLTSFDPGALGNGCREADKVLLYANKAAEALRELGAEVSVFFYHEPGAKRYTLREKGERAAGNHLFISCHLNSVDGGVAQGTEVLYYKEPMQDDTKLALFLKNGLVSSLGFRDRGIYGAGLGVLSNVPDTVKAACLVEPFFINFEEIGNEAKVDALCMRTAEGLVNGIVGYCKATGLGAVIIHGEPAPTPEPIPVPSPVIIPEKDLWQKIVDFLMEMLKSLFAKK